MAKTELEALLDTMEKDALEFLREMAETTDPFGVTGASQEDLLFDWLTRGLDPDSYWERLLANGVYMAITAGLTFGDALIEVVKHSRRMQEMEMEMKVKVKAGDAGPGDKGDGE